MYYGSQLLKTKAQHRQALAALAENTGKVASFTPAAGAITGLVHAVALSGRSFVADGIGATQGYRVSAGALPAGTVLDPVTGAWTGTPTTAASYSWTIEATDQAGNVSTAAYTTTVA
jgi:hypothetical protein